MNDLKRDMMRIQELIGNAFRQTGSLVALTDGGQMNPNKLQKTLEQTMEQFEAATLELRKLCERYAPGSGGFAKKPILPSMDVTGSVEAFGYGWLHITINTLLPHCRYWKHWTLCWSLQGCSPDFTRKTDCMNHFSCALPETERGPDTFSAWHGWTPLLTLQPFPV